MKKSPLRHRFDAPPLHGERLSDDERLVATVRCKDEGARRGDHSDRRRRGRERPVRARQQETRPHLEAFWTPLADPPLEASPGAIRVACYFDADAPGRIRVFVASCTSRVGSRREEEDGVFEKRGLKNLLFLFASAPRRSPPGLSAPLASSASYVRVSLNRVDPGVRPKDDRDARRLRGTPTASRTSSTRRSCTSTSTGRRLSVLLEFFRKRRSAAMMRAGAIGVTVKSLPRA